MAQAIAAVLDHVAIAVPDAGVAERRWGAELGAAPVSGGDNGTFKASQYRFANGAKLELLSPSPRDASAENCAHRGLRRLPRTTGRLPAGDNNFIRRFLDRYGSAIHHVTLKVPDLAPALGILEAAGLDVVDVDLGNAWWREAFLRPKQVGGLVVQVASSIGSDEDRARRSGYPPTAPSPEAPDLWGPRLRHPDLDAAARLWSVLGADVERRGAALLARWPRSALEVLVERGDPAGPVALRMGRIAARPAEPGVGPAVEVTGSAGVESG